MSEHIHPREAPLDPTVPVSFPTTATPCHDIQRHADQHLRQVTCGCEVGQDVKLDDHIPDGNGGCQGSTDSPSSSACCHLEQGAPSKAQLVLQDLQLSSLTPPRSTRTSSPSGDIDINCKDSRCCAADVSCAPDSLSIHRHRGRCSLFGRHFWYSSFFLDSAKESGCCPSFTLKDASGSEEISHIITGPAPNSSGNNPGIARACTAAT